MGQKASSNTAIRDWILSIARAGHGVDDIVGMMVRSGYTSRDARQWVARTLNRPAVAMDVDYGRRQGPRTRHPEPPAVAVDGRRIEVSLCVQSPVIRVLDSLLDDEECTGLIEAARPRMDRSLTVDTSGYVSADEIRTSQGMFFERGETELVRRIERRLAKMVDLPVTHGDNLQILHYLPGQQYKPHHDWFDPTEEGYKEIIAAGGQRIASIIMYLNTPAAGGGTQFPGLGLTVTARRGTALYFAYEGGDPGSLHAGLPVTQGEKWIATKWLREQRAY
jgi:prolyl 4-hydroxylase